METLYIDESGDPGLSNKASKNFIFGVLLAKDEFLIKKILRKTKNKFKLGNKKTNYIFHANQDKEEIKIFLLKEIAKNNLKLFAFMFEKKHFDIFNIEICFKLLKEELDDINVDHIVFAQRETNKNKNRNIINILENTKKNIKMTRPSNSSGLQIADLISWSLFQKYENNNLKFFEIIKNNLKEIKIKSKAPK